MMMAAGMLPLPPERSTSCRLRRVAVRVACVCLALAWSSALTLGGEANGVVHVEAGHEPADQAIQQALDQLPATGGVVELGPGHFLLSSPLRLPNDRPVEVRGQGRATVLDAQDRRGRSAFILSGGPSIVVRDLTIKRSWNGIDLTAPDPARDIYQRIVVENIHFMDTARSAVQAEGDLTINHLIIRHCQVERARNAFSIRNDRTGQADIIDNTISDLTGRAIMVGSNTTGDRFYRRNITIRGNTIRNVVSEQGGYVMGILGYGSHYLVADNYIENVRGGRAEGIYLKVRHSVITRNHLVDAGGRVGAIALAGNPRRGPDDPGHGGGYANIISENIIQFKNPGVAQPRGIDSRQKELLIAGNIIEGFSSGIMARRGGHLTIVNNRLALPRRDAGDVDGISLRVATGDRRVGPQQNVMVSGNEMYGFYGGTGAVTGLHVFTHSVPAGSARMDNLLIANNLFTDFSSERHARAIWLHDTSRDGGMARILIRDNLFHGVEAPLHIEGSVGPISVQDNLGLDSEVID